MSLPSVDEIVLHAFLSVGPSKAGAPIDWHDLESYSRLTSASLTPWESECVMSMSRQYCLWLRKGEDQHCASPWSDGDIKADETSESVNSAFKSLRSHALSKSKKRSQ